MEKLTGPAYRIETSRLVIRCYNPADAPLLHAAVEASREHLKPWMPWAHQDQALQDHVELLRTFRGQFDLGEDFIYGIFNADESRLLGGSGLHTRRGAHIREIGYWVRVEDIRRGFASETAAALVKVAFEIDRVQRVEIRVDPDNAASAAIPARLGFTREGNLRAQSVFLDQPRDTEVWSLLADEYPSSPASEAAIRAYDVLGRSLLV